MTGFPRHIVNGRLKMDYNENLCLERHKRIDESFKKVDGKLENHDRRIDVLEQYKSKTEAQIDALVEQIKNLVTTMRWFMGLLLGGIVGFFFFALQQGIFK